VARKCGTTWPGAHASEEDQQKSVLGDWTISRARARGVRTVAGVVNGAVAALLARLDGRVRGWT
jgi:hypothetical protein